MLVYQRVVTGMTSTWMISYLLRPLTNHSIDITTWGRDHIYPDPLYPWRWISWDFERNSSGIFVSENGGRSKIAIWIGCFSLPLDMVFSCLFPQLFFPFPTRQSGASILEPLPWVSHLACLCAGRLKAWKSQIHKKTLRFTFFRGILYCRFFEKPHNYFWLFSMFTNRFYFFC